jgi:integrase
MIPCGGIIALISDTGMRVSEAVGLRRSDLDPYSPLPTVLLVTNSARRLKTRKSVRRVPLVGAALWAARRVLAAPSNSEFAFPSYITSKCECKGTTASNALNAWIAGRGISSEKKTLHCFRHAVRDRLRNVGAPSDVCDRIGGWVTVGVGEGYGQGTLSKCSTVGWRKSS